MVSFGRPLASFLSVCRTKSPRHRLCPSSSLRCSWSTVGLATCLSLATALDTNHNNKFASLACADSSVVQTTTSRKMTTSSSSQSTSTNDLVTRYLNAEDAAALDVELMSTPGFTLEQLMELAGLSVAQAVYAALEGQTKPCSVLVVCGPGNNGGDGLVAARHLVMFGCDATVVYPKQSSKQPHYANLVQQCEDVGIEIVTEMPEDLSSYSIMVDAIFGFSFQGTPREPFATILSDMMAAQKDHGVPILSVDIPSGWNVNDGDTEKTGFAPEMLISLTAPKLAAKSFTGRHFVGGRFLSPALAEKYKVQMPPYEGVQQIWEAPAHRPKESSSWEEQYHAYLVEKDGERMALDSQGKKKDEELSWEVQYAQYLAEKEAKEFKARKTSSR